MSDASGQGRPATEDEVAQGGARAIHRAFELYVDRFHAITHRAREHFLARDWHASRRDAVQRLDLYGRLLRRLVRSAHDTFGERILDRGLWTRMRTHYASLITGRHDVELAETFFNSLTRKVFRTVGVDKQVEFVRREGASPSGAASVYTTLPARGGLRDLVRRVLEHPGYPFADVESCTALVTARIAGALAHRQRPPVLEAVEVIDKGFYRGRRVYMVGRLLIEGDRFLPLVIALRHPEEGVVVDAVLFSEDDLSILFSFSRSFFRVDLDHMGKVIDFLRALMPRKPVADLYNALGFHKHGKTELYRQLLRHLKDREARFVTAPGDKGMVMIVFVLEGTDLVFKVIRDRFAHPKTSNRAHVMERYHLVHRHDRAGRLVGTQEFEHLRFDRARFSDELLTELAEEAADSVVIDDDSVAISHLYTERRLEPLNLYLRGADEAAARHAVDEYGWALRDLAGTNIFPGDLLLKNFGVSRHGRVIFYDYDELLLVTDCRFRELPPPRDDEDDWRGELAFYVGPHDVFPEEFLHFIGFNAEQKRWFVEEHAELLTAAFWREFQRRHESGEIIDIAPYAPARRLRPERRSETQ